jgi:hypothetical protein
MKPLRIRIDRIADFGTIVSLIGVDTETTRPVTVHVDHRPFASFWEAWREADFPQPIEYDADRLLLHLDMMPADDGDDVQLTKRDSLGGAISINDRQAIREIEQ